MKDNQFIINKMPVPTFRWLKMNEAKLEIPGELTAYQPSVYGKLPERIEEENGFSGSMSTALDDYFREKVWRARTIFVCIFKMEKMRWSTPPTVLQWKRGQDSSSF